MLRVYMLIYALVSVLLSSFNCFIAHRSFKEKTLASRDLGIACICAAVVNMTYMISAFQTDYLAISVLSSAYFYSIDLMLVFLVAYIIHYTETQTRSWMRVLLGFLMSYCTFEFFVFLINPFKEIAISYIVRENDYFAAYEYDMHLLYDMHLVYTYAMVAFFVTMIIWNMLKVPHEYKKTYRYCLWSVAVIVATNAIFLFVKIPGIPTSLDLSVLAYSIGLMLLYWSTFVYPKQGMLSEFRSMIIESVDRGVILFSYDNRLLLVNDEAKRLLPKNIQLEGITLERFFEECRIHFSIDSEIDYRSIQCYLDEEDPLKPTRCDYRIIKNKHGEIIGRLIVLTDVALESDILTGFHNWDHFCSYIEDNRELVTEKVIISILDINGLALINSTHGRSYGDQTIQQLAGRMRACFPKETYFVRGMDAYLIALNVGEQEDHIAECIKNIEKDFEWKLQYIIHSMDPEKIGLIPAVEQAYKGLRAKKLLDKNSAHSHVLTSLMQALEGCDSDTEAHVKRTQKMGELLGKRIGLSDLQLSQLSLLCMLHDIGKIGIPLEILNKPGKLTDQEWRTIQTHVEKGFQIANSTEEFLDIAPMIRSHHERWDGKGYPDGLSRESIPLLSRIIAVVDSFDAMVNNRSYRKALPLEIAFGEIRKNAGTQFDPFIASEFLQMLEENPSLQKDTGGTTVTSQNNDIDYAFEEQQNNRQSVHIVPFSRYILDGNLKIVSIDEQFTKLTGYTMEEVAKQSMTQFDLLPADDKTEYIAKVTKELANHPSAYFEHRIQRKDGMILYVFCFGKIFYDSVAREQRSEIIVANMTDFYSVRTIAEEERDKVNSRLVQWENTYRKDALTGLLNRSAFISDVEEKLLHEHFKVLMLMVDVDKFKEYNDTYGHHAGDEYLILVAQTLEGCLRKDDLPCRMGGDEFAAALFFKNDIDDQKIYERTQQVFDKINITLSSKSNKCSISMGAAISSDKWNTFHKLYEAADNALYTAKEGGRGCLRLQYPDSPFIKEHLDKGDKND